MSTLNSYTKHWFLEVNPKKTKCLTFARGKKTKNPDAFFLGDVSIEVCDTYCYLGVFFARSGSMKSAYQALNDKALGAMFSIIRNMKKHYA